MVKVQEAMMMMMMIIIIMRNVCIYKDSSLAEPGLLHMSYVNKYKGCSDSQPCAACIEILSEKVNLSLCFFFLN
jgi:hypothetical protein